MPAERGIAQVRTDRSRRPVGLAFAVGPHHLVTCAHVVNAAIGREKRDASKPDCVLLLDFPFGGTAEGTVRLATIAGWRPDTGRDIGAHDDLAVLKVTE